MRSDYTVFSEACRLLGINPALVPLVGPAEWKAIVGRGVPRRARGVASPRHRVVYVKRGSPLDVFVHELLHLLFPSRPHWWIYEATWSVCGIETKERWRYSGGHWTKSGQHKMEPVERIRQLALRSATRRGLASRS